MRFILTFLFIFTACLSGFCQVGNEWINYSSQYFKIPVAKDGIYRLSYNDLLNAGFPSSSDPKTFQLFHRGIEQAITVNGESDNQFNPGDYIEFFGQRNDGTLDAELYVTPAAQPHPFYNLYSDTTSYFLTFGSTIGKRAPLLQQPNTGLSPETFHFDEKLAIQKDYYSTGVDYGDIQKTAFDEGEGWTGAQIIQTQSISYTVDGITLGVQPAGNPIVEILMVGRGPMVHSVEVSAGSRVLGTVGFTGYQAFKYVQTLLWTDISSDGKLTITARVLGSPDRISVSYIRLRYPQQTDMSLIAEKVFNVSENLNGPSYLEIKNPSPGTLLFDITDPNNLKKIFTTQTSTLNAVITSSASKKIFATSNFLSAGVKKISFRNINPAAYNYVIVSHPSLRKPTSGYTDPVKAYAEYRAQPQGGQFDTLVVNITQLYDQFNYGEQSPLAIFQFMKYLASGKLPSYLFLIGKGIEVSGHYYRTPNLYPIYKDLVPTAGTPGSDMAFTTGLSDSPGPAVATGRLSASGPLDVAAYLNKIKENETRPFDDLRRKNILHLSGGLYEGEPQIFKSYLQQFGSTAKSFYFGADVKSIAKQSTNQEVINVAEEINKGLSLITFFGHSSSSSSDFDIGFVTDPVMGYSNKGKYPVFLLNGCLAGSAFLNFTIFGENWTNTSNKGAIGVIAHSNLAYSQSLRNYSSLFYQVAFTDPVFIHKGIGDVQAEVARRYLNTYGVNPTSITQSQQMVLLGDPAAHIFGAEKPDYEIRPETVSINSVNGETITALTDSLKVSFVINNYGLAKNQPLKISITRTLKDGNSFSYDSLIQPVLYSDTISFVIPGRMENGFGNNTFTINIDSDNSTEELREDNNSFGLPFFIPLNRTRNLYPDNYSIVNKKEVYLSFQHTDLLAEEREFILELDTSSTFDSGFKKQYKITAEVLASQKIQLLDNDSVAYYWRTRLSNPLPVESTGWENSSFTFIENGPTGWAQIDFPQYLENELIGLVHDPVLRKLNFLESKTDIAIKTFGGAAGKPADSTSFKIKGIEYNLYVDPTTGFLCRNNTINFIAFDKKTTQPYPGIYFTWQDLLYNYGGRRLLCGREPYVINSFTAAELVYDSKGDLIKYIDNVAAGDSVIVFNIGDAGYGGWPEAAKLKLGELGISLPQINSLTAGEPVVMFARKGAPTGSARIFRSSSSPADQQELRVTGSITGRTSDGEMKSVLIGPAVKWKNFIVKDSQVESSDVVLYEIVGVKRDGSQIILKQDLTTSEDLSDISPVDFPFLKVKIKVEDVLLLTPANLDHWLVTYDPVPEGILLYKGSTEKLTFFEGQTYSPEYQFVNISDASFGDSLAVKYSIQNPLTFESYIKGINIKSPLPRDTSTFQVPFTTVGLEGLHHTTVNVNPGVKPEQSYDNNSITLKDHVEIITDSKAPVLDVTFDGRHIENNDFVSTSPKIDIVLWDNNPYLLKKDTIGINLFLADFCDDLDCDFKAIYFSRSDITWSPESEGAEFKVSFNPQDLPDGTYTLRVSAIDAHGNKSGDTPYQITFQVSHENEISLYLPYPNPLSDQTNFEFTVTGVEAPSKVSLSVISVNGRLIQDIEQSSEMFYVGRNIVSWRSIDTEGNPLPNGVYIYEISVFVGERVSTSKGKLIIVR